MYTSKLVPAVVALAATLVSAKTCKDEIEITTLNPTFDGCDIIDAEITVSEDLSGALVLDGPEEVRKGIRIVNATSITSITSTTITSIKGKLELVDLRSLNTVSFSALEDLDSIEFITLPYLDSLTLGSDSVTKANSITLSNTRLNDLSGLKLNTVDSLTIDNNQRLTTFNSELESVGSMLRIVENGKDMEISMNKLETVGEVQLRSIKSFEARALETVNKSLKFEGNPELTSFRAPNVTSIKESLTFIDNNKLANVSFPLLTKIGDMTIQNNTALGEISGFPKLESVTGGVILRGDFDKVELPELESVIGGVTVSSTTDIEAFCKFFDDAKADNKIDGDETCSWNNPEANSGGDGGEESDGSTGGSGSGSDGEDGGSAAGTVGVSMAMLGLAVFAGVAQLL